jgi:hypothetical protein
LEPGKGLTALAELIHIVRVDVGRKAVWKMLGERWSSRALFFGGYDVKLMFKIKR